MQNLVFYVPNILTNSATICKIKIQTKKNREECDSWSNVLYEFFILKNLKIAHIVVLGFFSFYHLMQSAYKILSYCIYKCNLHPMLVVEIFGTFYNV